jgi:hypothetical protein
MLSGAMLSRAGRLPAWFRFASVFLALLLLFLSTSPTGAQSLGAWTRVGILPAGAAAVALATDGTVYRLDSGGQLWRRSSDTTPWSSYLTTLLPDARGIAVAAGRVLSKGRQQPLEHRSYGHRTTNWTTARRRRNHSN